MTALNVFANRFYQLVAFAFLCIEVEVANKQMVKGFEKGHPRHIKNSIPYNLARRLCTIVSENHTLNVRLQELNRFLLERNYPEQ